eukprot:1960547-Prymnesium_polylepis.1
MLACTRPMGKKQPPARPLLIIVSSGRQAHSRRSISSGSQARARRPQSPARWRSGPGRAVSHTPCEDGHHENCVSARAHCSSMKWRLMPSATKLRSPNEISGPDCSVLLPREPRNNRDHSTASSANTSAMSSARSPCISGGYGSTLAFQM